MRASSTITGIFAAATLMIAGAAMAQENTDVIAIDNTVITADECVWDTINTRMASFNELSGKTTLTYNIGSMEALTKDCEEKTGTDAHFFKGIKKFDITIGNTTMKFQ